MEKTPENIHATSVRVTDSVDKEQTRLPQLDEKNRKRYYGFRIGELGLLALPESHSECLRNYRIYPVPNTHPWFRGMINLRGDLLPVFDLDRLLFPDNEALDRQIILVLDKGEHAVGIVVEDYPCAIDGLQPLSSIPSIPELFRGHCLSAYATPGSVWVEFNHRSFFYSLSTKIPVVSQVHQ